MKKILLAILISFSIANAQQQMRATLYPSPTSSLDLGLYNAIWDSAYINHFKGTSLNLSGNATIGGTLTFSSLTANRLVATNGSSALTSSISSSNLRLSITDPTGTGSTVFSASPTLTGTVSVNEGLIQNTLTSSGAEFRGRRDAIPVSGSGLAFLNAYGRVDASTYVQGGELLFRGDGSWGVGSAPTTLRVRLVPSGSTTLQDVLTIFSTGNITALETANARGRIGTTAAWQSSDYVKQATGFSIGNPDNSIPGTADFRYIYTDGFHAKAFIADLEQALAGSQIIAKSVAKIDSADFTVPTAGNSDTLVVEEFAGFTGRVFVDGDIVRIRNFSRPSGASFGGSLTIADAWGTVTFLYRNANNNPPTQAYTFTRSTGTDSGAFAQASNPVKKGTLVIDYGVSGDGFWEVDNTTGKPFARTATWTTHPASGIKTRTKLGELGSGKYGILGRDANDANDVFRIDQDGARFASAYFTATDWWAGNASLSNVNTTFALEALNTSTPTLALGSGAGSMNLTVATGVFMDGGGNFRAGAGTPVHSGILFNASTGVTTITANSDTIISASSSGATIARWTATDSLFSSGTSTTGLALNTGFNPFLSSTGTGFEVWNPAAPKMVIGVKNGLRMSWNHDVASGVYIGGNTAGWKATATGLENTSSSSTITGGLIRTAASGARLEVSDDAVGGSVRFYTSAGTKVGELSNTGNTLVQSLFNNVEYRITTTNSVRAFEVGDSTASEGFVKFDAHLQLEDQVSHPGDPGTSGPILFYRKGSLIVFKYNDSGTIRYKYLDMAGTGVTWVHTTTAP